MFDLLAHLLHLDVRIEEVAETGADEDVDFHVAVPLNLLEDDKKCGKECLEQRPETKEVEPGHFVACHKC